MNKYLPAKIEVKWQKKWVESDLYKVDLSKHQRKYYLLVEFTYPSGDLHMGHWFAFAVPDILSRMKRMQGYTVFAPNGFDAFGLPAENAAIVRNIHPRDWTFQNIKRMKEQFSSMGVVYDWEHEVITCDPNYYKWNQWIFLKMFEKGLAYRGKTLSNWCPKDKTVLANENVENGKCWRCQAEVVQKEVEQWFLKITDYADKLIWDDKNAGTDWPKSLKEGQNNWIGKSKGIEINFSVAGPVARVTREVITVYTKFPETIYGVTYVVLAPEHPLVSKITTKEQEKEVQEYIKRSQKKSELERTSLNLEKSGVFTGAYCVNPVNGRQVPIWISDYVISIYGTGAVMGVPGSDHRDFAFAKRYGLEIIRVIGSTKNDQSKVGSDKEVLEEGWIVNSGKFDGLATPIPAKEKMMGFLEEEGWGERKVNYHLHDWSISRQRYWGTPIPIIYCDKCGTVPVPEKDLPVKLPYVVDFAPRGKPPLATAEDWVRTTCPNCGGEARREVETMDTFVDSSWYFLRYLREVKSEKLKVKSGELPWDPDLVKEWIPVDIYFGGAEHTLGHTLYSRFFVKFLKEIGILPNFAEYAQKRVQHGVILGPDGSRMSKSRGNVVNPDDGVKQYGADAVRLYLAFLGPYDLVAPWDPGGIRGVYNFLQRVWRLYESVDPKANPSEEDNYEMNRVIKKVGGDVEAIKFNTAVSTMMEWLNWLSAKAHESNKETKRKREKEKKGISREEYVTLLKLLAPFAPHMTEELWSRLSGYQVIGSSGKKNPEYLNTRIPGAQWSIHQQPWPKYDPELARAKTITLVVQVNGKVRGRLPVEAGLGREEAEKLALRLHSVQKYLDNKKPQRIVFVQDRLINFVV